VTHTDNNGRVSFPGLADDNYGPRAHGCYYDVFVPYVNTNVYTLWGNRHITHREVWDWIDQHVEPRGWHTRERPGYSQGTFFCFEDRSDALLFKLTWGGGDV
jgi:hypothetical protein